MWLTSPAIFTVCVVSTNSTSPASSSSNTALGTFWALIRLSSSRPGSDSSTAVGNGSNTLIRASAPSAAVGARARSSGLSHGSPTRRSAWDAGGAPSRTATRRPYGKRTRSRDRRRTGAGVARPRIFTQMGRKRVLNEPHLRVEVEGDPSERVAPHPHVCWQLREVWDRAVVRLEHYLQPQPLGGGPRERVTLHCRTAAPQATADYVTFAEHVQNLSMQLHLGVRERFLHRASARGAGRGAALSKRLACQYRLRAARGTSERPDGRSPASRAPVRLRRGQQADTRGDTGTRSARSLPSHAGLPSACATGR